MNKTHIWYLFELLLIFIGIPLAYYLDWLPVPKIVALLVVAAGCILVLKFDSAYDLNNLLAWPKMHFNWKTILLRSSVVAAVIFSLVMISQPDALFSLPKELPWVWSFVMLLYPVLSVIPQEVIYRVFFFERYRSVFKKDKQLVMVSAFSFAFLHIVYDNWWAVTLSFLGGLILSWTYQKSRSLWWVSLEHAIYGCLIFTIGMGNYFYESL